MLWLDLELASFRACEEQISTTNEESHIPLHGRAIQSGDIVIALTSKFGTDLSGLVRSSGLQEAKLQLKDKNLVLVGGKGEIEKVTLLQL